MIVLAAARGNAQCPIERTRLYPRAVPQDVREQSPIARHNAFVRPTLCRCGYFSDARVLTASRATGRQAARADELHQRSRRSSRLTRQKQNAWLQALQNWCDEDGVAARRLNSYRCLFFEWAATNFSGFTYTEANMVGHNMVDFVRAHSDTFNSL